MQIDDKYEVIVVGGGHAACEAALASSRIGAKTLLLNLNLDNIAYMPCNPSIGGPAKGHLVREIDALGGEIAKAADASTQHLRWLNTSKGPAVKTLRAQCNPRLYSDYYRRKLLNEKELDIYQAEVTDVMIEKGEIKGVKIKTGQQFYSKTVIIATGTYLGSKIHIGLTSYKSGPIGQIAATEFARNFKKTGLEIGRLRTDTTPRLKMDTINWDILEKQKSISEPACFSYFGEKKVYEGMFCGLTRTNEQTHEIIRKYFPQSPIVQGTLDSLGPRYCPSIDDKIIKFPEKETHPIFLEPISLESQEVYMQNFSTSMCVEAQIEAVQTIKGCESAEILRPGYSIEYDYVQPTQLEAWLETKNIKNLFLAGQINGTSGYEEAGAQGLIAGINAALIAKNKHPVVLTRNLAYIGVLIDDLITKGTNEPYRMFTSRCEYRLLLRHDSADERLAQLGYEIGLNSEDIWEKYQKTWNLIKGEKERLENIKIAPTEKNNEILRGADSSPISEKISALSLLKRPEINWEILASMTDTKVNNEQGEKIAISLKYEGYIERQKKQVKKMEKMEKLKIPKDFDFSSIPSLSAEGKQKFLRALPRTLGQASRISGVPPTDIQLLWVAIENRRRSAIGE